MSIATPEGVDIDLILAGVGSRFVATVFDQLVQSAILLALAIAAGLAGAGGGGGGVDPTGTGTSSGAGQLDGNGDEVALAAVAVTALLLFSVQFGYHVLFETLASGRTPGKRWTGLRVVTTGGGPVSFLTSVVRNLLRVVDFLPGFYGVAIVSVLATRHNQRLGDIAAGTLVVRERLGPRQKRRRRWRRRRGRTAELAAQVPLPADAGAWDVSSVTAEELATVRRFLERRTTLTPQSRSRLAHDLAVRLRPKVVGPGEDLHPELFLEELAAAKAARL